MKATSISFVGFDVLYDNVPNVTLALNGEILYQQSFETVCLLRLDLQPTSRLMAPILAFVLVSLFLATLADTWTVLRVASFLEVKFRYISCNCAGSNDLAAYQNGSINVVSLIPPNITYASEHAFCIHSMNITITYQRTYLIIAKTKSFIKPFLELLTKM
jgi:hypothetical protein